MEIQASAEEEVVSTAGLVNEDEPAPVHGRKSYIARGDYHHSSPVET